MRPFRSRPWCVLAAIVIVAFSLSGFPVRGHDDAAIDSFWSLSPLTIDGVMSPSEWADAAAYDLGAIPGNGLPAFMLIKNNDTFLWLAYDAVGDTTEDPNDTASFAFDTGHDGVGTAGREDQFVHGYYDRAHFVFTGTGWTLHDSPFDTSLPNHAGLAANRGFGASDLVATPHRIFEFQVPLALLGLSPGDTVGLFGGSQPVPGIVDYSTFVYSTWPYFVGGPIPLAEYGDLTLGSPPSPVSVVVTPSIVRSRGEPQGFVRYDLLIQNTGSAGGDTFDITTSSAWPIAIYGASGTTLLVDTDGDSTIDTGNVTDGGIVKIVAEVEVPFDAVGCANTTVTATSSWDPGVNDTSILKTCTPVARFAPPHTDFGVDTDSPPNGFFDRVELDVNLSVTEPGTYVVQGVMLSLDGAYNIDFDSVSITAGSGPASVSLFFDARYITASGIPGPYRVELDLLDTAYQFIDNNTHITNPYALEDFDPPNARFDPPHSDFGRDTDSPPNGLYDELVISVSLLVSSQSTYRLAGYLYDDARRISLYNEVITTLAVGAHDVELVYSGVEINEAGADGPYTVELVLYDWSTFEFLGFTMYQTGPYPADRFDGPPIQFSFPSQDFGIDADTPADGLLDWLVVRVAVTVNEPRAYVFVGSLYAGSFDYITGAFALVDLTVGTHTVDLRFPGPFIAERGLNGPYRAEFYVTEWDAFNYTDFSYHYTAAYQANRFNRLSGALASPHADQGIDTTTPPDGLFDWIAIDAAVDVTRAGEFEVEVDLLAADISRITSGSTRASLPLGGSNVRVLLDASAVRASGFAGPYLAAITLNDRNGLEIAFDDFLTRSYALTELQPADTSAPSAIASVSGGYWRNSRSFRVNYVATDPAPSDMLASVALYYRYSSNNATWGAWTLYGTQPVSLTSATGSFAFDAPDGEGYYEFAAIATDGAGNAEPVPTTAESRAAVFVPAQIEITPTSGSVTEGQALTFQVHVRNAAGQATPLQQAMTISLLASSTTGQFRTAGSSTAITEITIPAGASSASFDFVDATAGTVLVVASADGVSSGTATVAVAPSGPFAAGPLAVGLAGGVIAGLAAGVAVGWFLARRKKPEQADERPESPPGPPPEGG